MSEKHTITPIGGQASLIPAKGLVHALSEIQFISRGERLSGSYDPELVAPFRILFSFCWEGVLASLVPLIITILVLPISVITFNKWVPAFGTYDHDVMDKILIILLSFSPGLLKTLFVAYYVSTLYLGKTTRTLVNYFVLYGMIPTIVLTSLIGFLFYHVIYLYVINEEAIRYVALNLNKISQALPYPKVYYVLSAIRQSLPIASVYLLGYLVLELAILISSYTYASYKTKKLNRFLQKWNVREES